MEKFPKREEFDFAVPDLHNDDQMRISCKIFTLTEEFIMAAIAFVAYLSAESRACATHDTFPLSRYHDNRSLIVLHLNCDQTFFACS